MQYSSFFREKNAEKQIVLKQVLYLCKETKAKTNE